MEKGSVYIVVSFPENFPEGIQSQTEIFSTPLENSTFKIYAFPDGHLLVLVQNHDFTFSKFESQQIRFNSNQDRIITYIWSDTQTSLKINNKTIDSDKTSEIFIVSDEIEIQQKELKSIDFNLDQNIEKWIIWRKERFSSRGEPLRTNRREKSEAEQVNELRDVVRNLEDNFKEWLSEKNYLIMSLLALLRSLLCHKVFEKNVKYITYNPLMFRVASFKSIPLPIYARPINSVIPKNILDLSKDTLFDITVNEASMIKISKSQVLIDYQEWINGEVIITFKDNKPIYYSVNDMLLESSNTIGASHFDPDIPLKIDFLRNITSFETDLIKKIVSNTCDISIIQCKNILSQF